MNIAIIAFTQQGGHLARQLMGQLADQGHDVTGYLPSRYEARGFATFSSLADLMPTLWPDTACLIFIGACGIAVRAISPHIISKASDPAVLVLDEQGKFAISLLSGHLGGGNKMTALVADLLSAQPVITTATDLRQVFAVDVWAGEQMLAIHNPVMIKEVSSRLLHALPVGFRSDYAVTGPLPPGLTGDKAECGIFIGADPQHCPFPLTLHLLPKNLVLGLGCRRNTPMAAIAKAVEDLFREYDLPLSRLRQVCTIDIKRDEEGLLAFCHERKLPLAFYTAAELAFVPGDFTPSSYVAAVTGVDNVCERSAARGSGPGRFLIKKTAAAGITLAVFEENYRAYFPDPSVDCPER